MITEKYPYQELKKKSLHSTLLDLLMWQFEHKAFSCGYKNIAGVDEAGRGPLAGPVVSAAVILPHDFSCAGIDDSKKLSEKRRDALFPIE